ncbi:MAG: FAD-dependent oxidoreductase [Pseudomonadota bacterium]
MRIGRRGLSVRGATVRFTFDGEPVDAIAGETVAAAMAASGRPALRRAVGGSRPVSWRGQWCGMGSCYDCAVTIDGRIGQRACLAKVHGGEVVRSDEPTGKPTDPLAPLAHRPSEDIAEIGTDVLVIGAGPAGLSAAIAARRSGAQVLVLDERPDPGGQYFKPVAASHTMEMPPDAQFRKGISLWHAARREGVEFVPEAMVWGAEASDDVLVVINGKARRIRARALILATGAHERAAPIPGWTLPGVMTTGAAQTLSRAYQVAPGRRVVIAGNGPLNLQLAVDLSRHGVDVVALAEIAPAPGLSCWRDGLAAGLASPKLLAQGLGYLARLRRNAVPVFWSHVAARAEGGDRLRAVELREVDADGTSTGKAFTVEADALCLGYGFISGCELAATLGCRQVADRRHLGSLSVAVDGDFRTSVPGVFAVGDGAKVAGAAVAMASGAIAGAKAAEGLGFKPKAVGKASRALTRSRRFQDALWRIFAAPPVRVADTPGETVMCRCEGLTFAKVRDEIHAGAQSLAVLKRRTRLAMGRCQGRVCTVLAAALLREVTGLPAAPRFAPRSPLKPFPAAALAREKPEWGGHQRAGTPNLARPLPAEPFGTLTADTVVIGGGVVGACLAYELSDAGHDVVVVERDDVNLQASGSNAGSLHVQLLSFDFGHKAEAGGGPAAATLPLGPWAVGLWQELAELCGRDFEIRTTGGLMVASSEGGMAFLDAKAKLERRHGIDAQIIGRDDLLRLAPALNPSLIGAEYVAAEGKINPLTATYSVMAKALAEGARLVQSADVTALERTGNGWSVETNRGEIACGRVINAGGPWARPIAALANIDIPVHSAPLQMIVTERAPTLVDQLIAHADRHLSLKQLASGGLVIGGAWPGRYDEALNLNRTVRESVEGNIWAALEVLPQLSGLHILRTWAGMNVNIDGAPIVGEVPGAPGFFNCVTSNGYTLAPAVARLTAELIAGRTPSMDIAPYTVTRFG